MYAAKIFQDIKISEKIFTYYIFSLTEKKDVKTCIEDNLFQTRMSLPKKNQLAASQLRSYHKLDNKNKTKSATKQTGDGDMQKTNKHYTGCAYEVFWENFQI